MIRSHAQSLGQTQSLCPQCRQVVPAEIHIIPFCTSNVLYRDGHVPLPKLTQSVATN